MTMNYMMYSRSHFVKGMELMVLLICSLIQDSESLPLVPTTKMFLRRFIQAAQASHKLRDGSSHQGTVTSMEPNEGTFVLHTENTKKGKINHVHLVDVPGHSRLRPKLEEFLPQAAAIVFVVDALETDKLTAHTKEFIRKQMEKEIEKLRASRSAVSTAVIANDFSIGIEGEVFSFSHCYNKVTVAEASGLTGETVQIQDFIREYIKP